MAEKIQLFEYFLKGLVQWFCEVKSINESEFNDHPDNNLSKLKVLKLHFFACSTEEDALDIFDNFYALPYGHVESDVYDDLNELNSFQLTNHKLIILNPIVVKPQRYNVIDRILKNIKASNRNLIVYSAFDLVELSHLWFSWKYYFEEAQKVGSFSGRIDSALIKQESKIYSL